MAAPTSTLFPLNPDVAQPDLTGARSLSAQSAWAKPIAAGLGRAAAEAEAEGMTDAGTIAAPGHQTREARA